jgi:hypothetical protein
MQDTIEDDRPSEASGRPDPRVMIPVAAAVAIAATVVAVILARALQASDAGTEGAARRRRPAPSSTINVNWGLALFGTNVVAASRPGRGLRRFARRR